MPILECCDHCRDTFTPGRTRSRYCSPACQAAAERGQKRIPGADRLSAAEVESRANLARLEAEAALRSGLKPARTPRRQAEALPLFDAYDRPALF